VDIEFGFGPFDSKGPRMTVLLDPSLWRILMLTRDLNPETLRWFVLLHQFDFKVVDKDDECMVKLETLKKRCLRGNPRFLLFLFVFLSIVSFSVFLRDLFPFRF